MKKMMNRFIAPAFAFTLSATGAVVMAQDATTNLQEKKVEQHVFVTKDGQTVNLRTAGPGHVATVNGTGPQVMTFTGTGGQGGQTFSFVASEVGDNKVVKGAPYSAEIVNEFVQTLANGNRIVRRSSSNTYRDSQGRTRREQAGMPVVMSDTGGTMAPSKTTIINDNVEGYVYILDEQNKTARRIKVGQPGQFHVVSDGNIGSVNTIGGKIMMVEKETTTSTLNQVEEIRKINVTGSVLQGSAINRVQPVYPPEAKAANVAGPVTVKISISETGDVISAEAISGHPLLRDAAVAAARQWKFKTTELSGKAVKVEGSLTFNFTLADGPTTNTLTLTATHTATGGEPAMAMTLPRVQGIRINAEGKATPLGKQMIEGIECEGTRIVETIPAGQIGNEQAIEIVIERWVSPALGLTVLSKHSDPLHGDTTVKMTNISRNEPGEYLFKVPSDYTIKEGPAVTNFVRTTKPE